MLTLYAPTQQNSQTHSKNSLATANELSVFSHFVRLGLKGLIVDYYSTAMNVSIVGVLFSIELSLIFRLISRSFKVMNISIGTYYFFFNCYLAAPRPTLGHYRGDSFTHRMLTTAVFTFSTRRSPGAW